MTDRLSDLPEGNQTADDPVLDVYFGEKKTTKRGWKDYLKIVGLAIVAFVLAGNPFTGLFLSKVSLFQGAYKNFAAQTALFLIVFGLMLWYF
jgi:formate hydrogenlyase subunit 3/multisubunit Na+/H+ antiporter MnhD subunit